MTEKNTDENCAKVEDNKSSEDKLVLQFPIIYRIGPIFSFVVFTSVGVFYFVSQMVLPSNYEEWPYLILLFLIDCWPGIMLVCWSLWKVEAGKDGFVYRNYFGIKREYKFSELEYKDTSKGLKWYFLKDGKKVITIAYFIENGDTLYKLYRKYKRKQKRN